MSSLFSNNALFRDCQECGNKYTPCGQSPHGCGSLHKYDVLDFRKCPEGLEAQTTVTASSNENIQ